MTAKNCASVEQLQADVQNHVRAKKHVNWLLDDEMGVAYGVQCVDCGLTFRVPRAVLEGHPDYDMRHLTVEGRRRLLQLWIAGALNIARPRRSAWERLSDDLFEGS
jgi:hypothetical protein